MMDLETIVSEARQLDDQSRAALACQMIQSLTPPPSVADDVEVSRRIAEAEVDPSVMLTKDQFLAGLDRGGR